MPAGIPAVTNGEKHGNFFLSVQHAKIAMNPNRSHCDVDADSCGYNWSTTMGGGVRRMGWEEKNMIQIIVHREPHPGFRCGIRIVRTVGSQGRQKVYWNDFNVSIPNFNIDITR